MTDQQTTATSTATVSGPGDGDEAVRWQLAGDAAEEYERYLVPAIFASASRRLVAMAEVGPGDRVLDAACGTAAVARRAVEIVGPDGAVTGLDRNAGMLATAARVTAGLAPPVRLVDGQLEAMPFADSSFDIAIVQEALQFVEDPTLVLRELARVTVPDGTVATSVFRSLDHQPVYAILVDALGRHVGEVAAGMMASPFGFGHAERLRAAAGDAGLVRIRVVHSVGCERFASVAELVRQEAASSPLAAELGGLAPAVLEALVQDLEQRLAPWVDDDGIVFPNETTVLTASVPAGSTGVAAAV